MKKALSLLLALVLSLSLCACSDPQDTQPQASDSNNTESNSETESSTSHPEEPLIIESISSRTPIINIKRFNELIETVELTTENWKDYIEVYSYTDKSITRDAFGEITSEETTICYELGAKGNKYHHFREVVIELRNKATGEMITLKNDDGKIEVTEDFTLEEYECTRIKGTLYLVDVPAEVIFEIEGSYHIFRKFSVGSNDYDDNIYLSGVDGRHLGGVFGILFCN